MSDNNNNDELIKVINIFEASIIAIQELYIYSLKYKFFNKLIFELPKFKNNNEVLFTKYQDLIFDTLQKVSISGKTILFYENKKFNNTIQIDQWKTDDLENPTFGFWLSWFKNEWGSFNFPSFKLFILGQNNFKFLWNDEIVDNEIFSDISIASLKDKFHLENLKNLAASLWKNILISKGILQFPEFPGANIKAEVIAKAVITGFYIFKMQAVTAGFHGYETARTDTNVISNNDLTNANFISAENLTKFMSSMSKFENDFLKAKGFFSFEKDGTFNAHNEEIKQMKDEKNKLLFKKMKSWEKLINKILLFIVSFTGEELIEGEFKFVDLVDKLINDPIDESASNKNQDIIPSGSIEGAKL